MYATAMVHVLKAMLVLCLCSLRFLSILSFIRCVDSLFPSVIYFHSFVFHLSLVMSIDYYASCYCIDCNYQRIKILVDQPILIIIWVWCTSLHGILLGLRRFAHKKTNTRLNNTYTYLKPYLLRNIHECGCIYNWICSLTRMHMPHDQLIIASSTAQHVENDREQQVLIFECTSLHDVSMHQLQIFQV